MLLLFFFLKVALGYYLLHVGAIEKVLTRLGLLLLDGAHAISEGIEILLFYPNRGFA